jgi:hypothetical protein
MQDELCTKEFGLGYHFNVQTKLANKMPQNAAKIQLPVLLLHDDSDIVALPTSSKIIFKKLASLDKKTSIYSRVLTTGSTIASFPV